MAPIGLGVAVANSSLFTFHSSLFTLHFQHSSLFILQRYKKLSTCARVLRICFRFIWSVKIGLKKRLRYSLGAFSIFTPSVHAIRLEKTHLAKCTSVPVYHLVNSYLYPPGVKLPYLIYYIIILYYNIIYKIKYFYIFFQYDTLPSITAK